jgi:hypothetical protein
MSSVLTIEDMLMTAVMFFRDGHFTSLALDGVGRAVAPVLTQSAAKLEAWSTKYLLGLWRLQKPLLHGGDAGPLQISILA